jgi:hypothetical protein
VDTPGFALEQAARLGRMSVARVRALVAAGVVAPAPDGQGRPRFSFGDLQRLRQLQRVPAGVSARRLGVLLRHLPPGPLRLAGRGRRLWTWSDDAVWEPESGQVLLRLGEDGPGPTEPTARLPVPTTQLHYRRGRALEASDRARACEAYRCALAIDPDHPDANINLGRLVHEAGCPADAATLYRAALRGRPHDAVAWFNLGVALGDLSDLGGALAAYEQVLELDPSSADAHFNAARLCERRGDRLGVVRHLRAYRRLSGG